LIMVYRECHIVYFASTYEGFGLPIIEGMSIGRPVVTSNISPMKDVANGAALLVDPNDWSMIRMAILSLMGSKDIYQELIQKGLANARRYQADSIASKYLALYSSIVNHG
jgi:glycosyltransferase involved in cell wall biosynthesis